MHNLLKKFIFFSGIFFLLFFFLIFVAYLLIDNNILNLKTKLYKNYPNIQIRKDIFNKKSIVGNINNDYNIKFLPYTEFEKVSFRTVKINFSKEYYNPRNDESIAYKKYGTFFIDFFQDDLLLTDYQGTIYLIRNFNHAFKANVISPLKLNKNANFERVYDTLIIDQTIYISHSETKNNCKTPNISFANLNYKKLIFKKFYTSSECNKNGSPGKLQPYKFQNKNGLLMSTAEGKNDLIGTKIQDENSIYGKILFIPIDGSDSKILSKGHRVIQGLNVDDNNILATEHGPRGGDEINKILENGNYGWPIASYGERYDFKYTDKKISYKKNHKQNNFIEPIFSFLEGIGISEIIKVPINFSKYYSNHYALASLNGRTLYLLQFNKDNNKLLTLEKIFLNYRIRDLKYYDKEKSFILALEEDGYLGILQKN